MSYLPRIGKFKLSEQEEKFIRDKVAELPKLERMAVYFFFWKQEPLSKIAVELGLTNDEVLSLFNQAKEKLRLELTHIANDYFGTLKNKNTENVA